MHNKQNPKIEKPFKKYCGALSGVIGKTKCKSMEELHNQFSNALGHKTSLYLYGNSIIKDERIAIVAGGGNSKEIISEMIENNVNVLITGISTEKFACQKMCNYFEKLGLPSTFIEGEPVFENM